MSYFAELDVNNVVLRVVVCNEITEGVSMRIGNSKDFVLVLFGVEQRRRAKLGFGVMTCRDKQAAPAL